MFSYELYFILFLLCVVALWWYYFSSNRFYKLCLNIPGPKPLPFIGNIHQISVNPKLFPRRFLELSRIYYPTCRAFLGTFCFVMFQDADDIHAVLNNNKTLSKAKPYMGVQNVIGRSLLTVDRDEWKKYRRIMNPGFKPKALRSYLDTFNEKSKTLVSVLSSKSNSEKFDIHDVMMPMAADAIIETGFGEDMKIQENNRIDLMDLLHRGKYLIQTCILNPIYWFEAIFKCTPIAKEARKVVESGREITDPSNFKFTRNDERSEDNEKKEQSENSEKGFAYRSFKYMYENCDFLTSTELEDQIRILLLGGTDTVAFTLSVCIMLLGHHKEVQDKIVEELTHIFCDDRNGLPEYEEIQKMTYTEQVIKEAMRLFTIAFATGRRVEEEVEVGGYVIPAGVHIVLSPYLLHRNPRYFAEPLKFDPERFSPENIRQLHPHCFIPFLAGPRNCIGHYYAMLLMKIALCHALRNFEILPCGSREEMEDIDMQMFLSLKHGYNVRIKTRENSRCIHNSQRLIKKETLTR